MDADEIGGVFDVAGQRSDRQRRRIRGENNAGRLARIERSLGPRVGLCLGAAILEHRFEDEIAARERRVIGARADAGHQRVALGCGGAPLVDLVGDQMRNLRLAFVRGLLVAIDQRDLDPRGGGDVGNTRAHEARADDADATGWPRRNVGRAAGALVEVLHRHEQRAHHRRSLRRTEDFANHRDSTRRARSIGSCSPS